MCLSTIYRNEKQDENILCRFVESIQVDGISGATVSSKAVARCVSSAVGFVTGADVASSATTWGG